MFSTVLQELKGYLGQAFLLTVFVPVVFFAGLSASLYLEVSGGFTAAVAAWERLSAWGQTAVAFGALFFLFVAAYIALLSQYTLTRIFEGYWPQRWPLDRIRSARVAYYRERRRYLKLRLGDLSKLRLGDPSKPLADAERRILEDEYLATFPPGRRSDRLMPTRIGNILRASEVHAYDRYGIDSVVIWTRLRPLLPAEAVASLEQTKAARDFFLLLTVLSAAFALAWCPLLAAFTNRWDLCLVCCLAWLLSGVFYRNAVESAVAYGERVKATFDVYRSLLPKALGIEVPADPELERALWLGLSRLFYRNLPFTRPEAANGGGAGPVDEFARALTKLIQRELERGASGVAHRAADE